MHAFLILGAAVWENGPSPTLMRRTRHAADLWRKSPDSMIVPCGGLGLHAPSEACVMRDILQHAGVPAEKISIEDQSTTTIENIRFALPILEAMRVKHVTIVTDKTHAPRAALVARHFGLRAHMDSPPLAWRYPSLIMRQAMRECAAYPLYRIKLSRLPPDQS